MPPPQGKNQQKGKGKGKGQQKDKRKAHKGSTSRTAAGDDSDPSGDEPEVEVVNVMQQEADRIQAEKGIDHTSALFLAWLNQNGASYPKLEWPVWSWPGQPHDGERGVRCTEDIAPGEPMFSIPGKILFNRQACMSSPIAAFFVEHKELFFSQRDELALTLMLLYEKLQVGKKSFWWPMIAALPADPGAASLWSEAELDVLQDDSLKAEAMVKVAEMKQTFMHILQLLRQSPLFNPSLYTFEEFRWALLCVESRTFGRFLPFPSLVPFADLLNHVNVHTSYRWDPAQQHAVYSCDASGVFAHSKGMEAFMSYGPRSNRQLLLHYGFALDGNEYEGCNVQFRLTMPESERERGGRKGERVLSSHLSLQYPCLDALALFREAFGGGREAQAHGSWQELSSEQRLWSVDGERGALAALKGALEGVLSRCFATGLDEDQDVLRKGKEEGGVELAALRWRMAVLYRIGRKRLIRRQIEFVDAALSELQTLEGGPGAGADYLLRAFLTWTAAVSESADSQTAATAAARAKAEGEKAAMLVGWTVAEARRLREEKKGKGGAETHVWPPVQVHGAGGGELSVSEVCCGPRYTAVLTAEGGVLTCGEDRGQLGQAATEFTCAGTCLELRRVRGLDAERVVAIACGEEHTLVAVRGGGVWAWGGNERGECGQGHRCHRVLLPARVREFGGDDGGCGRAVGVAGGEGVSVVWCEEGEAFGWGRNYEGQCGVGQSTGRMGCVGSPTRVEAADGFRSIVARGLHCAALTVDGKLLVWGCGVGGRLGLGPEASMERDANDQPHVSSPTEVAWLGGQGGGEGKVVACAVGATCTVAVREGGGVFVAGSVTEGGIVGGHGGMERVGEVPRGHSGERAATVGVAVGGRGLLLVADLEGGTAYTCEGMGEGGGAMAWSALGIGQAKVGAGGDGHWVLADQAGGLWGWGRCELGQLGVPWTMEAGVRLLEQRVVPTVVGETVHPGVVCGQCRCQGLRGVRYSAVTGEGGDGDVCGRCMAKGVHRLCSLPTLASHRRLPPGFRPVLHGMVPRGPDVDGGTQGGSHGVDCSACGEELLGGSERFKCGNCAAFELCAACYERGRAGHLSTHLFLRLPRPLPLLNARSTPLLPLLFPTLTADVVVPGPQSA